MERGVRGAVVLVRFIIIVQREVKGPQSGAEWNRAVLIRNFWIRGITPDLRSTRPNRIPTEVVISHMGESRFMRLRVRPSLTGDPISSGVGFSIIVTA